jgi:hypothetical protein
MLYRSQARAMIKDALTRFEQRLIYYEDLENGKYPGYRASEQAGQLARHRRELGAIVQVGALDGIWDTINDDMLSDLVCKCVILGHYYGLSISGAPDLSGVSGNTSPFVIYDAEPEHADDFRNMHPADQLAYLKRKVEDATGMTEIPPTGDEGKDYGPNAGGIAADLRALLPVMKLDGLFALDKRFMNVTLRHFLNISENGKEDYTWGEVTAPNSGWEEAKSLGAKMHQTDAPSSQVVVYRDERAVIRAYNRLNAKFTHRDGREAVFRYVNARDRELVISYPDKGTFNYYPGRDEWDLGAASIFWGPHQVYDMDTYTELMKDLKINTRGKCNIGLQTNSHYWQFDRDVEWSAAGLSFWSTR